MRDREGHRAITPWTDEAIELATGHVMAKFTVGEEDSDAATVVFIAQWPAGCRVDAHTHESDYCEILLKGSQKVGATWFHEGDVRIARAGHIYGPLVAGDEGCTIALIFNGQGWTPIPARPDRTSGLDADDYLARLEADDAADDPR